MVSTFDHAVNESSKNLIFAIEGRTPISDDCEMLWISYGTKYEDLGTVQAIVYTTGDIFVPTDWTADVACFEDIEATEWIHLNSGKIAILVDCMPKVI